MDCWFHTLPGGDKQRIPTGDRAGYNYAKSRRTMNCDGDVINGIRSEVDIPLEVTPRQDAWGGYETWLARSSYLEADGATKIRDKLLELLTSVAAND